MEIINNSTPMHKYMRVRRSQCLSQISINGGMTV